MYKTLTHNHILLRGNGYFSNPELMKNSRGHLALQQSMAIQGRGQSCRQCDYSVNLDDVRQGMVRDASASCGAKDQGAGEEQWGALLLAKENQRYGDIHSVI